MPPRGCGRSAPPGSSCAAPPGSRPKRATPLPSCRRRPCRPSGSSASARCGPAAVLRSVLPPSPRRGCRTPNIGWSAMARSAGGCRGSRAGQGSPTGSTLSVPFRAPRWSTRCASAMSWSMGRCRMPAERPVWTRWRRAGRWSASISGRRPCRSPIRPASRSGRTGLSGRSRIWPGRSAAWPRMPSSGCAWALAGARGCTASIIGTARAALLFACTSKSWLPRRACG